MRWDRMEIGNDNMETIKKHKKKKKTMMEKRRILTHELIEWEKNKKQSGKKRSPESPSTSKHPLFIMSKSQDWHPFHIIIIIHVGVSKNNATPKWMVYFMEHPMNKWMIWGAHPYFWKHPLIYSCSSIRTWMVWRFTGLRKSQSLEHFKTSQGRHTRNLAPT